MQCQVKVLSTVNDDLDLRELTSGDAAEYHALVQRNRGHLTRLGDYKEEVAASADDVAKIFTERGDVVCRFGVFLGSCLIGRVDLVPVDPPRYGLGYWLSEDATGKGLATIAVAALLRYAEVELDATDVYAGVTHGNERSVGLLRRLGFEQAADFDTYTRFHRPFGIDRPSTALS